MIAKHTQNYKFLNIGQGKEIYFTKHCCRKTTRLCTTDIGITDELYLVTSDKNRTPIELLSLRYVSNVRNGIWLGFV